MLFKSYSLIVDEGSDFRVLRQEPCLDGGVAIAHAVTLGNQDHFFQFSHHRIDSLFRLMAGNVLLHVLIGQASIAFLVCIALDGALFHSEVGVVLASRLEEIVFSRTSNRAVLRKSSVHHQASVSNINLQIILHNHFHLSFFQGIKQPS